MMACPNESCGSTLASPFLQKHKGLAFCSDNIADTYGEAVPTKTDGSIQSDMWAFKCALSSNPLYYEPAVGARIQKYRCKESQRHRQGCIDHSLMLRSAELSQRTLQLTLPSAEFDGMHALSHPEFYLGSAERFRTGSPVHYTPTRLRYEP
jgi:hypothetical protein